MCAPLIQTTHYQDRCEQRAIELDACEVLYRYGERFPGRSPDKALYRLNSIRVLELEQRGLDYWTYVDLTVVVADDKRALTVFRKDDEASHRRWAR